MDLTLHMVVGGIALCAFCLLIGFAIGVYFQEAQQVKRNTSR
jgi:hypothetical protein